MAEDDRQNKFIFKEVLKNLKIGQALQQQARQTVSAVGGHVREVLGPFSQVTDFMKNTLTNMGSFFKGIGEDLGLFKGAKSGEEEELERQTGILESMLDSMIADDKEKFREGIGKKGKKGVLGLILGAFAAIALAMAGAAGFIAGGFVRSILIPFEVIYKAIRGITRFIIGDKAITRIGKFFGKFFRVFGKIAQSNIVVSAYVRVGDFFIGVRKFFSKFKFLLKIFKPVARLFDSFLKGFIKGFKILGWPITILMTVIDFIRGFMATEGDILAKIEGGIKFAVKGFFELPIKIIGWIIDKITGWFTGKEVEKGKTSKTIMGWIDKIIGVIFSPWELLLSGVEKFTGWFTGMWNSLIDSIVPYVKEIPFIGKGMAEGIEALKFDTGDEVDAAMQQKSKAEQVAGGRKDKAAQDLIDSNKELSKKMAGMKESQDQTGANIVTAVSTKKEKDVQEPPSGIEEAATMWLNLAM
jgi:hypothetical protein